MPGTLNKFFHLHNILVRDCKSNEETEGQGSKKLPKVTQLGKGQSQDEIHVRLTLAAILLSQHNFLLVLTNHKSEIYIVQYLNSPCSKRALKT